MGVTNIGISDAVGTTASAGIGSGNVVYLTGPVPTATTIPANGGYATFTWTYSANGAGNATLIGSASTTGSLSGQASSNTVLIQTDPSLTINFTPFTTSTISTGQGITVIMNIQNSGQATANNLLPQLIPEGDSSSIGLISALPSAVNIPGNLGNANFTWIYNTTANGVVNFYGQAAGTDANSGAVVSPTPVITGNVTIESPVSLASQISLPATVSEGESYVVYMTITNTGQANSNAVTPGMLMLSTGPGSGTSIKILGPSPANANISGLGSVVFSWTYSATGTGSITFTDSASGTDVNSGNMMTSPVASASILVQKPSALSASISALPATAKTGGAITVVVSVTNGNGCATATGVSVTPQDLGKKLYGAASAGIFAAPSPVAGNIPGNTTQTFTWVYTAGSGVGSMSFTGFAMGIDGNAGWPVSSLNAQSNSVAITPSANLISSFIIPITQVSVGQVITVMMSVSNNGGGTSNTTNASALTVYNSGSGSAQGTGGPVPFNVLMGPSATQMFTWTYSASSAGTIFFSGNASGTDSIFGIISSPISNSTGVIIQNAVNLGATITAAPSTVSTGQLITVIMSVTNNGGSTATGVLPITPAAQGTGAVSLSTTASPQTILAGNFATFTWTYSAASGGTVIFTTSASGIDINSGATVSSPAVSTSNIIIQNAALLAAQISGPAVIGTGDTFTMYMTVTNTGQAPADLTTATIAGALVSGAGTLTYISGPQPASITIIGGASVSFSWVYSATGALATFAFAGNATGTDNNSGLSKTAIAAAVNVVVQTPAPQFTLPVLTAIPGQVSVGQLITVVLGVTNNGLANATNTTPTLSIVSGNVSLQSGPLPATATIPANGGYATFTWTYKANAAGTASFNGSVTSLGVTSSLATSNNVTIQTIPVINISYQPIVAQVSVSQQLTIIMGIVNSGQATIANVVPVLTGQGDTAGLSIISGPQPANATLTNGTTGYFTWTYNIIGSGTVNFFGQASGTDVNSGLTINATPVPTSYVAMQTPAGLASSIILPATVSIGQWYTVYMSVTNTGQAAANNTAPGNLFLSGTGTTVKEAGPAPANAIIPGGSSTVFTWTYSASGTGNVIFTGIAQGADANSGSITTSPVAANSLLVQKDVGLTVSISALPNPAKTGAVLTVVAVVTNGANCATAGSVSITPQDLGKSATGAASATVLTQPSPAEHEHTGWHSRKLYMDLFARVRHRKYKLYRFCYWN